MLDILKENMEKRNKDSFKVEQIIKTFEDLDVLFL